jgi:shikimate kinase
MKSNLQEKTKIFTLIGMSGSGKTALSHKLSADGLFHYSIDYEIAHTHLKDKIKQSVISKINNQSQFFRELIEKFAIKIDLSLTFDDLEVITMFVIPTKENGKVNFGEFLSNQNLYRTAELQATQEFWQRAKTAFENYEISGFVNDTTGSVCEISLNNKPLLDLIKNRSTVVYLKTTQEHQTMLVERAKTAIKPILYNYDFLLKHLTEYYNSQNFTTNFEIDKEFFFWLFPKLLEYRKKSYTEFVEKTDGKIIDVSNLAKIKNTKDFIELIYEN